MVQMTPKLHYMSFVILLCCSYNLLLPQIPRARGSLGAALTAPTGSAMPACPWEHAVSDLAAELKPSCTALLFFYCFGYKVETLGLFWNVLFKLD